MLGVRSLVIALLLSSGSARAGEAVSFTRDVMAVLSRAGCNSGACHGNLNGKGGLRLSLRGEDPDLDHTTLSRDLANRRVSVHNPAESLLLRKAAGLVSHEGGPRFAVDSREYRILLDWITDGLQKDPAKLPRLLGVDVTPKTYIADEKTDRVKLKAVARFADGSSRDVTDLCAVESTHPTLVTIQPNGEVRRTGGFGETVILVRYLDRTTAVPLFFLHDHPFKAVATESKNPIDRDLYPQWASLKLQPSAKADDGMFLRRVTLDTLGRLPTSDEARKFLTDETTDKRSRLIDSLVQRPEFADFWAAKWCDILHNEEKALDPKGVRVFHQWIRDAIAGDRPLNEFAAEIVSARGSTYKNPATNMYRALRDPYARGESVAQVFLGIRLQCAKCHNHPFDIWTQDDYHRFAALFAKVDYRVIDNTRRDELDKHEFIGEQIVFYSPSKELPHPRTGEPLAARLLGKPDALSEDTDRTEALAEWMADPANPFFAKAQVNRVWFHLFGRGLVEPNDDFRVSNPPANAKLMDDLAAEFKKGGFRLKGIVKLILKSETYQLSSVSNATNAEDDLHFSKAAVQPLEAEQLMDAIMQVGGAKMKFTGYPTGTRAIQMAAPLTTGRRASGKGEKFMKVFGKPERLLSCECERSDDPGLIQAFQLINGDVVQRMLAEEKNILTKLTDAQATDDRIVEELFLAAYSRFPKPAEKAALTSTLGNAKNKRAVLEDVLWGILNSKEFLLRR